MTQMKPTTKPRRRSIREVFEARLGRSRTTGRRASTGSHTGRSSDGADHNNNSPTTNNTTTTTTNNNNNDTINNGVTRSARRSTSDRSDRLGIDRNWRQPGPPTTITTSTSTSTTGRATGVPTAAAAAAAATENTQAALATTRALTTEEGDLTPKRAHMSVSALSSRPRPPALALVPLELTTPRHKVQARMHPLPGLGDSRLAASPASTPATTPTLGSATPATVTATEATVEASSAVASSASSSSTSTAAGAATATPGARSQHHKITVRMADASLLTRRMRYKRSVSLGDVPLARAQTPKPLSLQNKPGRVTKASSVSTAQAAPSQVSGASFKPSSSNPATAATTAAAASTSAGNRSVFFPTPSPSSTSSPSASLLPFPLKQAPSASSHRSTTTHTATLYPVAIKFPEAQQYYRVLEQRLASCEVSINALKMQPCMPPRLRARVFHWLADVCDRARMTLDTLFFAITYFDTYCSVRHGAVTVANMQLLACACLRLAAKIEETRVPSLRLLSRLTDGACQPTGIAQFELDLAAVLKWRLIRSTPLHWTRFFIGVALGDPSTLVGSAPSCVDPAWLFRSCQVLQLAMSDAWALRFDARQMAAAAVLLSATRPIDILAVTGLDKCALRTCLRWMHCFARVISEQEAFPSTLTRVLDEPGRVHCVTWISTATTLRKAQALVKTAFRQEPQACPPANSREPGLPTTSTVLVRSTPPVKRVAACGVVGGGDGAANSALDEEVQAAFSQPDASEEGVGVAATASAVSTAPARAIAVGFCHDGSSCGASGLKQRGALVRQRASALSSTASSSASSDNEGDDDEDDDTDDDDALLVRAAGSH
ncbi:hypothetical protein PTSG_03765 [Salpingoeca rosetta]|uniref:Cyclin-like domain-containing protein n=1 Tax=Salpingoeca rosetta (strain ATCC 50818 / BSB-021) TaxID=946362 RepID=F2U5B2_SALR5|nr:uncharacterized protein PTSG_03765 [Salpingoeca rosetta]EGD83128.1 hypothetical protein PTSG_03765 [Salpingoeca rosetta]|eukprot:XP_004995492.1 hypothetical protein PTSG_03765 [Salpingoeca rosetta]